MCRKTLYAYHELTYIILDIMVLKKILKINRITLIRAKRCMLKIMYVLSDLT